MPLGQFLQLVHLYWRSETKMCVSEERELRMKRLRRNLLSRHLCQVFFQLPTPPKAGDSQISFALTQKTCLSRHSQQELEARC